MDEILVKSTDGKWYILQGEELVPYGEERTTDYRLQTTTREAPKGVTPAPISALQQKFQSGKEETHERLEGKPPLNLPLVKGEKEGVLTTPPAVGHEEHPLRVELEELVDRVVTEVAKEPKVAEVTKDWDEVLRKRFRTIVSARLRDVRDAAETRQMLERPQKVGGLGMETREHGNTETIVEIIEKAFAEFQAKWRAVEEKKIEEWKKKKREQQEQREVEKEPEVAKEPKGTKVSEVAKVAIGKVAKVAEVAKVVAQPKPSVPSATFAPSATLPRSGKVTDIRPAPKLLGPVEELASLTLDDLRRLGAVEEAVKKIASRVEVLGAQGLARRLDGIKAWQNSPLHRLYMDLTAAAFAQRKSVDAVIADRQGRNEPCLTSAEFHGIMDLNAKFRV